MIDYGFTACNPPHLSLCFFSRLEQLKGYSPLWRNQGSSLPSDGRPHCRTILICLGLRAQEIVPLCGPIGTPWIPVGSTASIHSWYRAMQLKWPRPARSWCRTRNGTLRFSSSPY